MEKQHDVFLSGDKVIGFLTGTLCGGICSVVLALIFALLFTFTAFSESFIVTASYIIFAVSSFVCGLISVLRLRTAGLVNGLISGICFFVLYAIFSLLFGASSFFSVSTVVMLVVSIILSTLGGILAVNIR